MAKKDHNKVKRQTGPPKSLTYMLKSAYALIRKKTSNLLGKGAKDKNRWS